MQAFGSKSAASHYSNISPGRREKQTVNYRIILEAYDAYLGRRGVRNGNTKGF